MKRVIRVLLLTLLAVVLTGVFYIAVVMGQPQKAADGQAKAAPVTQPLPEPLSAPVIVARETELARVAETFPAPVMYVSGTSARLTFVSAVSEDVPFEGGVARVVTLTYRTQDFDSVTVQSIYPARALSLLGKDGRTFTGIIHDQMAGYDYVAMQDAATYRLHAQGEEALYVLTAPLVDMAVLDNWTNGLQLYRVEP